VTIREAIYARMVAAGRAPTVHEAAVLAGIGLDAARAEYRALADAHVIVLHAGSHEILYAPPFANTPTRFAVHTGARSYFGVCAWDAFGVPAALRVDARVEAACAWSGEPIACGVDRGQAYGQGVVHLLVPAAHFWDDIVFT
jgi:hypothetical protein